MIPAQAVPWPQRSPGVSSSSTRTSSPSIEIATDCCDLPDERMIRLDPAVEDADADAGARRAAPRPLAGDLPRPGLAAARSARRPRRAGSRREAIPRSSAKRTSLAAGKKGASTRPSCGRSVPAITQDIARARHADLIREADDESDWPRRARRASRRGRHGCGLGTHSRSPCRKPSSGARRCALPDLLPWLEAGGAMPPARPGGRVGSARAESARRTRSSSAEMVRLTATSSEAARARCGEQRGRDCGIGDGGRDCVAGRRSAESSRRRSRPRRSEAAARRARVGASTRNRGRARIVGLAVEGRSAVSVAVGGQLGERRDRGRGATRPGPPRRRPRASPPSTRARPWRAVPPPRP